VDTDAAAFAEFYSQTAQTIGIAPGTVTAHLASVIESLRDEFAHLTHTE
jgi:DNA-directed RNA polymerase specialized sigma24 family protein